MWCVHSIFQRGDFLKKMLFSLFLILLLVIALFHGSTDGDFDAVNSVLVSYIAANPVAREVFSLTDGAVET